MNGLGEKNNYNSIICQCLQRAGRHCQYITVGMPLKKRRPFMDTLLLHSECNTAEMDGSGCCHIKRPGTAESPLRCSSGVKNMI